MPGTWTVWGSGPVLPADAAAIWVAPLEESAHVGDAWQLELQLRAGEPALRGEHEQRDLRRIAEALGLALVLVVALVIGRRQAGVVAERRRRQRLPQRLLDRPVRVEIDRHGRLDLHDLVVLRPKLGIGQDFRAPVVQQNQVNLPRAVLFVGLAGSRDHIHIGGNDLTRCGSG